MDSGLLRWIGGALAGIGLYGIPVAASADDLCAPSEATDPQPLHINGSKPFVYKTVGGADLRLHVFSPAGHQPGTHSPAAVFFFGGGWLFGDIRRYQTQATHLALRGMVTVLVDYRVKCRQGSTIMDSVADGKSAMRWVRGHADELGIDPTRIAAVGSSAGAQVAAAAALITDFDDPADPPVNPRPDALVLYNPALDLASASAVQKIVALMGPSVADHAHDLSPMDHLDRSLPPTILFQGTGDVLVSPATAETFCKRARASKSQCEVVLYPGAPHGFTEVWLGLENPSLELKTEEWAADTSRRTDAFFTKLGWLSAR